MSRNKRIIIIIVIISLSFVNWSYVKKKIIWILNDILIPSSGFIITNTSETFSHIRYPRRNIEFGFYDYAVAYCFSLEIRSLKIAIDDIWYEYTSSLLDPIRKYFIVIQWTRTLDKLFFLLVCLAVIARQGRYNDYLEECCTKKKSIGLEIDKKKKKIVKKNMGIFEQQVEWRGPCVSASKVL